MEPKSPGKRRGLAGDFAAITREVTRLMDVSENTPAGPRYEHVRS